MPRSVAFWPFAAPDSAAADGDGTIAVTRGQDGTITVSRHRADEPQVYAAPVAEGLWVATDLGELVARLRDEGIEPAPHHPTVLSYLRGDDVASAPTTFFEHIARLRAGDELQAHPDGTVTRRRPQSVTPGRADQLPTVLADALDAGADTERRTVIAGEDLASAAVIAAAGGGENLAVLGVRAGSTRARDTAGDAAGGGRVTAAAQAAGTDEHTVHPTTEQFKKDLGDLVRTQSEPFAGLGVYAHYCAMREAARRSDGPLHVIDASGPLGAGLISSSTLREVTADAPGGMLSSVKDRITRRGRRELQADAVLDGAFVASAPAVGHLPAAPGAARDTAAVVAAQRNAERFGAALELPLVAPEVAAAIAAGGTQAHTQSQNSGGDQQARMGRAEVFAPLVPEAVRAVEPARMAAIDQHEWLSRLKGTLHQVFRSETFARRPWIDQRAVLEAFEAHVAGRTTGGDELFWRLLSLELWMRECVDADPRAGAQAAEGADPTADALGTDGGDDHGEHAEPDPKEPLAANPGKHLDLEVREAGRTVTARRYPIQTGKFAADSDMDAEVTRYVGGFFAALDACLEAGGPEAQEHREATAGRPWNLTISEKIIAIMQGRSYFVWDIHPTWWARTLSSYVSRTPAGIGLGDPVTMQLAIQEAGLPRVVAASVAGAVGKALGRRGVFYEVVGGNVRAIDGPTEYSVYPANVSAKLPPADPDRVAAHLNDVVRRAVPEAWRETFTGTVVMDANDLGRNTLGKAAPASGEHYELQFADNPLGQGREQTPMAIVFER